LINFKSKRKQHFPAENINPEGHNCLFKDHMLAVMTHYQPIGHFYGAIVKFYQKLNLRVFTILEF